MLWPESSRCIVTSTGGCVLVPVPLLCSLPLDYSTGEKVRTHVWFSSICSGGRSRGNSAIPLFMHYMSRRTQLFEDMWTPLMLVHPISAWHASCIPPATLVHCDIPARCLSVAAWVGRGAFWLCPVGPSQAFFP